ncbi:hypothetical protein [Streptomyces chartreusis]|uniref:hypothetical protein n=1 Tax=Streptomyces chartreusis TaxID=1969 RepID=UPI0033AF4CC1
MTAQHERNSGADALMAAIMEEPLPDAALADEHRAAVADVALLRRHLRVLGDALAEPAPVHDPVRTTGPAPVRPPRPRRRPFALALGAVGVAVAAALFTGMSWLVVESGSGSADTTGSGPAQSDAGAAASKSAAGYLSCSRLVVEGTVTGVEPLAGTGQQRVTLHVTRSYKPAKGDAEVSFLWEDFLEPRPRKGQHVLVGVPRDSAVADKWVVDRRDIAEERAWITEALPQARGLKCEDDG